ncbi:MAG TPA: hypothetical protein PK198_00640 [Saprospiraceae bacterium]|nr:hypothetical protein [Saprospiraceae bacterium]
MPGVSSIVFSGENKKVVAGTLYSTPATSEIFIVFSDEAPLLSG